MVIQNARKILIVGPAWVGDMVMAQSLFILLKQNEPNITIDVLAPAWSLGLLERMPQVSEAIVSPFSHGELNFFKRLQLGKELRARHYDQVIFIPNSFKSILSPLWAKIPLRTGWLGEWPRRLLLNDVRKLDKKRWPLMYQRFFALGLPANAPLPKEPFWPRIVVSQEKLVAALQKHQLTIPQKPLLILAPGAEFGSSKRWPARYFAEVAKTKLKQGWAVWIFGSPKDQTISTMVNELTQNQCRDLTGKTTLAEAIDLLSLAKIVIGNDSGLMHIAAALDKYIVAIYGPTPENLAPPLTKKYESSFLDLPCRPCFKKECPLGHWKCMLDLEPSKVLASMDKILTE